MKKILIVLICSVLLAANDLLNISLVDFTDRVSKQTLKSIYIDEDINASVSLYVPDKISSKDIFKLYKQTLDKNGFYLRKLGHVYVIKKHKEVTMKSHLFQLKYNSFADCKIILDTMGVKYNYLKDSNTFVLLVNDDKFAILKKYLSMVDKKQSQVTLKIMILEYQSSITDERGLEFGSVYKTIDGATKSAISAIVAPITNNTLSISKFNFYSALHFLNSNNLLNVKQFPYVLVKNNQKFVFEAVQNIPYLVTTTTTDNANTSVQTSIEYRDVGLKINGLAYIYDDYLSLNLDLIIEDLITGSEPTNTPETYKRRLNSSTDLTFGSVLLLSGIKRIKHDTTTYSVPFVSNLPYLGELFKYKYKSERKLNLTIAIEVLDSTANALLLPPEVRGRE
ncbi:hypothetical protein [Sulfurimonas sp. NWX367]|uniref:type II secretion system protein GspD n=1 Tax=Sulfurimonas sp. NWX367 TaxID=2925413 RepID=UPI003204F0BD